MFSVGNTSSSILLLFYFYVLIEVIFPLHIIPCKCHPTVELFILYFNNIKTFIPRGEKSYKVSYGKHTSILHHINLDKY